jgi:hypothetical protein
LGSFSKTKFGQSGRGVKAPAGAGPGVEREVCEGLKLAPVIRNQLKIRLNGGVKIMFFIRF